MTPHRTPFFHYLSLCLHVFFPVYLVQLPCTKVPAALWGMACQPTAQHCLHFWKYTYYIIIFSQTMQAFFQNNLCFSLSHKILRRICRNFYGFIQFFGKNHFFFRAYCPKMYGNSTTVSYPGVRRFLRAFSLVSRQKFANRLSPSKNLSRRNQQNATEKMRMKRYETNAHSKASSATVVSVSVVTGIPYISVSTVTSGAVVCCSTASLSR